MSEFATDPLSADFELESEFPRDLVVGRRLGRRGAFECTIDGEGGLVIKVTPCATLQQDRRFESEAASVRKLIAAVGGRMRVDPFYAVARYRSGGAARVGCYVVDRFAETLDVLQHEYAHKWEGEIRSQLRAMSPDGDAMMDAADVGVYRSAEGPVLFSMRGE